jgi:uncharacterized membrane protein YoaK (UPF0700 family)
MASAGEAFLVGVAVAVAATASNPGSSGSRYVLIVLLGLAMGMQNAVARKLAVPDLTTTVLTLTITGIVADGRLAGGAGARAGRRVLAVLAMFVGGVAGALLILQVNRALGIAVALGILCVVAATGAAVSRTDRGWIHPRPAN